MGTLPYGSWPSPITSDVLVEHAVTVSELAVGTSEVWWSEHRPHERGRVAIVRQRPSGDAIDVLPADFSARTRVHEYGGGAWWLHDDSLFVVSWSDQRVHRIDADSAPMVLTPEPRSPVSACYADGRVTADGRWVVCVRESHLPGGQVHNEIVAFDAHEAGEPVVLVSGPDFVSFPRPSPDGRRICWTQWNHPDMPWDRTELWTAELPDDAEGIALADVQRVAGGGDESIFQPVWSRDGSLLYVSDRTDFWNLYRIGTDGGTTALAPMAGDIGVPQWVFGQSRYAELTDGRLLCAFTVEGIDRLGVIGLDGILVEVPTPYTSFASLQTFGDGAVLIAASPTTEPVVAVVDVPDDPAGSTLATIRSARDLGLDPSWLSSPRAITFPTSRGQHAHALHYPPTNPDVDAPAAEMAPLVVMSHGGPTSAARTQLNLTIQFFTSRGIGVVDVNYRGSTGYGRAYRNSLRGEWGIFDVDDCIAAAHHLVEMGEADPHRLAIRGGSAGGFTTLSALTAHEVFAAGASLYGVADLEALLRDTHKFESRYLDGLIGPYPEARSRYVERSPINHTDRLDCPLIIFQGLDDHIVPPSQAEMMVEALRRKGLPFAYLAFDGEQHGFRLAANIKRVVDAELYFYSRIFRFALADEVDPVRIENL